MTRANVDIITRYGKYKFQANSSAYPDNTMGDILTFIHSTASDSRGAEEGFYEPDCRGLSEFIYSMGLSFGHVGNPSYFYEIDFVNKMVKAWGTKMVWRTAPSDWRERGWNCYEYYPREGKRNTKQGVFGWHDIVKGKLLYAKDFNYFIKRFKNKSPELDENKVIEAKNIDRD